MIRGLVRGTLAAFAVVGFCAAPAFAGNIALTGHDDDFHCGGGGAGFGVGSPCTQLEVLTNFVRAGSSLPVLVFDHGTELSSALTAAGIANVRVDPDVAV